MWLVLAYLERVVMLLKGRLVELMVMVDPSLYQKYITVNSKGESMLHVKIRNALYQMLHSALLFYRKLVDDLARKTDSKSTATQ